MKMIAQSRSYHVHRASEVFPLIIVSQHVLCVHPTCNKQRCDLWNVIQMEMLNYGSCVCTPVTEVLPERLVWSVVNNHGFLCIIAQVGKLPLLSLLSLTWGGGVKVHRSAKKYFWVVFLILEVFLIYFSIMLRSSFAI